MTLKEICTLIVDSEHKTAPTTSAGFPYIRTPNIGPGRVIWDQMRFVNEATYRQWTKRAVPQVGDLILAREAPVGNIIRVRENENYCLGQRTVLLRPNPELVDSDFLMYYILAPKNQSRLLSASSGATVAHLNMSDIRGLDVSDLPDIETQRRLVKPIKEIDELFLVNTNRIKILETMAHVLFREWFTDFKFPGCEKIKMIDSGNPDFGMIPTGWRVSPLPEICDFQEGPGIMAVDFFDSGVPLLRISGLKNGINLLEGCNYLSPEKVSAKWSHFRLQLGDILLSTSANLGMVVEVDESSVGAIAYTGIIRFRGLPDYCNQKYLKSYLRSRSFQVQVEAMGIGSIMAHFGPTHLKYMQALVPPVELQKQFEQVLIPIDDEIVNLSHTNLILLQIRDLLLPKLISGGIDAESLPAVLPDERHNKSKNSHERSERTRV